MTAAESCTLLAETVQALSAARRERDAWKLVAIRAIHFAREQSVELDRVRDPYDRLLDEHRASRQQQREAA